MICGRGDQQLPIALETPFEIKAYGPRPGDFLIGLTPIPLENWFEACERPAARKTRLFQTTPLDVWGEGEGSRPGQAEALGLIRIWSKTSDPTPDHHPPLLQAALLVEDDLCLMEKRDQNWTLTAASLCSASFFTALDAVGKPLHALHGPVPGFNHRFLPRVARIFDNLAPEQILERRNWSIVNSGDLSLPRSAAVRGRVHEVSPTEAASQLFVRSERQTLRRMPETGGVLFTIRIWRESLYAILADPSRRSAFTAAWEAAMSDAEGRVRTYKQFSLYDPLVRGLLTT